MGWYGFSFFVERFNREAEKHVGVHYECPFCGFHSDDLALLGIDSPAARKYKTVGMGVRPGMCWKCAVYIVAYKIFRNSKK